MVKTVALEPREKVANAKMVMESLVPKSSASSIFKCISMSISISIYIYISGSF